MPRRDRPFHGHHSRRFDELIPWFADAGDRRRQPVAWSRLWQLDRRSRDENSKRLAGQHDEGKIGDVWRRKRILQWCAARAHTASRPSPATLLTVIGGRRLLPKPPIGAGASDHRDECQTGDYHARVCLPWRRGNRRRRSGANFGLGRNERRYPFFLGGCRIRRWRWSVCHVARPWMRIL